MSFSNSKIILHFENQHLFLFNDLNKNKKDLYKLDMISQIEQINSINQNTYKYTLGNEISSNEISSNEISSNEISSNEYNSKIIEQTIIDKVDTIVEIGKINIIDDLYDINKTYKMIENNILFSKDTDIYNQKFQYILIDDKNKVCGIVKEWYDDNGDIPSYFKNKDNIVCSPDEDTPILIFIIEKGNKVYKEYNFLEETYSLQKTNNIEIIY